MLHTSIEQGIIQDVIAAGLPTKTCDEHQPLCAPPFIEFLNLIPEKNKTH